MSAKPFWIVYIIEAENGNLYTGITTDLNRRFQEHSSKRKRAKFFSISSPKQILFKENYSSRCEASIREAEIKRMSRSQKLELISFSDSRLR